MPRTTDLTFSFHRISLGVLGILAVWVGGLTSMMPGHLQAQTIAPAGTQSTQPPLTSEQQEMERIRKEALALQARGELDAAEKLFQQGLEMAQKAGDEVQKGRF